MIKTINTRMKNILNCLLYRNVTDFSELLSMLSLTSRQINYDIQKINDLFEGYEKTIKLTPSGKLIVDKEKIKSLYSNNKIIDIFSQDEYFKLIKTIVMFNIGEFNINKLSKKFDISRMTLVNYTNKIKTQLAKKNIYLKYDEKFSLTGNTTKIFYYRLSLLKNLKDIFYKSNHNLIEQQIIFHLSQSFNGILLPDINLLINQFTSENQLIIKDSDYIILESTILLIIWYKINNKIIPENINIINKNIFHSKINIPYIKLFSKFKTTFKISFTEHEKEKIIFAFKNLGTNHIKLYNPINGEIILFVFKLIVFLEEKSQYTFHNDIKLLNGLYNHLCRNYIKSLNNLDIYDNQNYSIDEHFDFTDYISLFCENISGVNKINKSFYTNEISYINLYFSESIYRNQPFEKKKIVLVSDIRYFNRLQLQYNLISHFEIELDNIDRLSIQHYDNWNNVDLALFTEKIPLDFNKCPSLKINIYLDQQDYNNILSKNINIKKQRIDFSMIYNYFQNNDYRGFLDFELFSNTDFLNNYNKKLMLNFNYSWEEFKIKNLNWYTLDTFNLCFLYNNKRTHITFFSNSINNLYIKIEFNDITHLFAFLFEFYNLMKKSNSSKIELINLLKIHFK